jgi:hypothetical protein
VVVAPAVGCAVLADATHTIQVCVGPVGEHLGEAGS